MKTRRLGDSDLQLSVLGMGCWQFGGGTYWGEQSQQDVDMVVHKALEYGVNYFDTAEVYNDGASEISFGQGVEGKASSGCHRQQNQYGSFTPRLVKGGVRSQLEKAGNRIYRPVHASLADYARVGTAFNEGRRLDQEPAQAPGCIRHLEGLQTEGKIRHIGISNHGVGQMEEVLASGVPVVANELAYNLLSRAIEEAILPYCAKHHVGVIGYMPLQQGLLTGKYTELGSVRPMQARSRHFHFSRGEGTRHGEEGAESEINKALIQIKAVADELGTGMTTLSLAWTIANGALATTIVGFSKSGAAGAEHGRSRSGIERGCHFPAERDYGSGTEKTGRQSGLLRESRSQPHLLIS